VVGGQLGGGGDSPVLLGEGMTKPVVDMGETGTFHCTTAQQDQHMEGMVLAQCTVTRDGLLRDCKLLKRVAGFDDTQVLEYLAHMKWKPAMQGSLPLSIKSFTVPLRIKCNS
jgi:protein TonB